ncbi:MAG: ABC transporter ATP-binding protein [Marinicaulis sp.]|nr:ABC transporter ATP-binding protein [Marinicaulis sp.]NNE39661.1 ABC transporter ATP-binding protein [Marinicaulis sp.]NNL90409.1 ABC transporter ATP-binding protein [Marinicaulis sp.]
MSLRLDSVSHAYGATPVVRDVSLQVDPGEIFCLFGPSGCGKTTILRLIAGLEDLQSGEIFVDDGLVAGGGRNLSPQRRPVGFVFQDFVLFPHLTVRQNIAFGLPQNTTKKSAAVDAQLQALNLTDFGDRYPNELSGGQQQRVALARTLIRNPKAILLDEPFASIDAALRKRLREQLRTLLKAQGVISILVTHDAEEALALGDRIGLMRDGRLIEIAAPAVLFDKPSTPEGARIFPGAQEFPGEISGGKIATAFGEFSACGLADGPGAAVIHDGAIEAVVDPAGKFAIVDTRFVGPGWRATVQGESANDETCSARIQDHQSPGARVNLNIDECGIFVFSQ